MTLNPRPPAKGDTNDLRNAQNVRNAQADQDARDAQASDRARTPQPKPPAK